MKKLMITLGVAALSTAVFAGPFHHGPGFHHGPAFHHGWHHGPHHGSFWGPGGRHFWPGFVGGVVGGVIGSAIYDPSPVVVTTPAVVTTPVVTTPVVTQPVVAQPVSTVQNVWVEGRYVDQMQGNGAVVRVWQPAHYEQRTMIVQ